MDPEQAEILVVYVLATATLAITVDYQRSNWRPIKTAFWCGAFLPILGLLLAIYLFWRWATAPPLLHDTDHHAMALIGPVIIGFLSVICGLAGFLVSWLAVTLGRIFRK